MRGNWCYTFVVGDVPTAVVNYFEIFMTNDLNILNGSDMDGFQSRSATLLGGEKWFDGSVNHGTGLVALTPVDNACGMLE